MGKKFTTFSEKRLKKIDRLSTVIFRLNYKNSDNIISGTVEPEQKKGSKIEECFGKISKTGLIGNLRLDLDGI